MKGLISIVLVILLNACGGGKDYEAKMVEADSVILESQKNIQAINVVLDSADTRVSESVYMVVEELQELKSENEKLKTEYKRVKTKVIRHDTIYITEKKNFWGKTKRSVDSTQSTIEDSTIQN